MISQLKEYAVSAMMIEAHAEEAGAVMVVREMLMLTGASDTVEEMC